uniref:Uncharacterized protein n=1 Tax=Arundo donax TaxID=35708 RepID=A0A0A9C6C2_ARUDO
MAWWCYSRLDS